MLADPTRTIAGHEFRRPVAERARPGPGEPGHQPAFPEFTEDLIPAFKRGDVRVRVERASATDRSVIDLMTADWTFLNERLALHYGIPGVRGGEFRRVQLTRTRRARACSARARVLMATSYANRTSPVVRGAWVLEHLMGTPPAAPPPGVEALPGEPGGRRAADRARSGSSMHRADEVLQRLPRRHRSARARAGELQRDRASGAPRTSTPAWRIDAAGKLADGTGRTGVDDAARCTSRRGPTSSCRR